MITKEQFQEAAEYIAGTAMLTVESALSDVVERDVTTEEVDKFAAILDEQGIHQCEMCEWFTHPGEGDGTYCDSCLDDIAMEESFE